MIRHDRELDDAEAGPLQEAFDAQAGALGLELEAPNTYGRDIGVFFVAAQRVATVGVPKSPEKPGEHDDKLLAEVIDGWERMPPEQAGELWRKYATEQFVGVGRGIVGVFNEVSYTAWRYSDELRKTLEEFPPYSPRRVTISELRVVYVGLTTAVATYFVQEDYENKNVRTTNAGVMALKTTDGSWKIAAATIPDVPYV